MQGKSTSSFYFSLNKQMPTFPLLPHSSTSCWKVKSYVIQGSLVSHFTQGSLCIPLLTWSIGPMLSHAVSHVIPHTHKYQYPQGTGWLHFWCSIQQVYLKLEWTVYAEFSFLHIIGWRCKQNTPYLVQRVLYLAPISLTLSASWGHLCLLFTLSQFFTSLYNFSWIIFTGRTIPKKK